MILNIDFSEKESIVDIAFEENGLSMDVDFGEVQKIESPIYGGPYEVTPTTDPLLLETAGKRMEEDMLIKAIPRFDVSNTAGGTTVYIGTEV